MSVDAVTGSAVYQEVIPQTVAQYKGTDIVSLYCAGIGAGIVFITLIFMLSLLINIFFDFVRKI